MRAEWVRVVEKRGHIVLRFVGRGRYWLEENARLKAFFVFVERKQNVDNMKVGENLQLAVGIELLPMKAVYLKSQGRPCTRREYLALGGITGPASDFASSLVPGNGVSEKILWFFMCRYCIARNN